MGIVFVSKWASQPEYGVLFSNLSESDAAAVVSRLKELKIKYRIQGDGDTIAVSPPDTVYDLRLTLASEGLPKGGSVGLEIFDTSELGTTTLQEKVKLLRGIQGELERTITALKAVEAARVHITQPEKTLFRGKNYQPKASVLVKLRGTETLTPKQIKGIRHLVAGSVEGLTPENVSIIDQTGKLLSPTEEEKGFEAEATRINYKRSIEKLYSKRIEDMLSKIVGPGKAVARVTAYLDFSSNEKVEENYDPAGQVIRSERSIEENTAGTAKGGVAGVVSNLNPDEKLLNPPSTKSAGKKEAVKNYEISKSVSKISIPAGRIQRLSVAVLLDGTYEEVPTGEEGKTTKIFKPLAPETLERVEQLVKGAIGYNPDRGDIVTVESLPFKEPDINLAKALEETSSRDFIMGILSAALPYAFFILFFLIVVRPLVKFLTTPTEAELDLERLLPTGIQELEQEIATERKNIAAVPELEPAIDLDQLEELMAENSRL
ncbi:MAG: flagellar M-ring protein FliF, partial [Candidatus Dadabacteria bacterium]